MCRETLEIFMKTDTDTLEFQVALQCAPVLAGVKISNLLILQGYDLMATMRLLRGLGVCFYILRSSGDTAAILVYHGRELVEYLQKTEVETLLAERGYASVRLGTALPEMASRYAKHMEKKEGFPHEIGLFLGYPPEDVDGFVRNGGRKYLCAGYWKVYARTDEKERLFSQYDAVTYQFLSVLSGGGTLRECVRSKGMECAVR